MTTRRALAIQALLVVGLLSAGLHAQSVGIGTSSPHPSARLHISDNARGLLIPNVALTATNVAAPVTSPATSLLVYNTNTAGTGATAVTPGFYYWDGSQWVRLADGGKAWLLTGNAGTDPAVNFLGTLDNNSLRIRVNNQQTFQFNTNFSIQRDAGGNARGQDAVDLQRVRSAATQVASGQYSVIGGGQNNTASGPYATVGGGWNNRASDSAATVSGGRNNIASARYATVGGGSSNTASGLNATVGGGRTNTASGTYATVSGGWTNTASGYVATVSGGDSNRVSGPFSTIGGGRGNVIQGDGSTISGGWKHYIVPTGPNVFGTIGGGAYDTIFARWGTISGGVHNRVHGVGATIGGGGYHHARGEYSTIAGGTENLTEGRWSTIGGGRWNFTGDSFATVGGGVGNQAWGWASTIGGGRNNVNRGYECTIAGGTHNNIQTQAVVSTICGGIDNQALVDTGSAILGGRWNMVNGKYSAIFGGESNSMSGVFSVTAGAGNDVRDNIVFAFGQNMYIAANESHRAYFFGPNAAGTSGNYSNSGFLVVNRFNGDYPIHVGTNNTNGNGAHLTTGGVWTNGSSRSFKERFVQYRPAEVLEKILQLPVEGYFYKGTQEYHITPMAEDFYRLFGTGVHEIIETDSTGQLVRRPNPDVDKYLAASDVAGVALLGIQALYEENAQLRQRVSDLETENTQLRQQISDIRTENAALRARLERLETLMQRIASTQTNP